MGRHDHQHIRAVGNGPAAAFQRGRDARTAGTEHQRDTVPVLLANHIGDQLLFAAAEGKSLAGISEQRNTGNTGLDHKVHFIAQTLHIDAAILQKRSGQNGANTPQRFLVHHSETSQPGA